MSRKVDHIDLNKHLTQLELIEYSSGVLGNEEMYRMELHLNECELCSDALEGIDQMKNAEFVINTMNDSILPEKKPQIYFPRSYYAIAASILLIAAVGFTFWTLNLGGEDKSLADNSVEEKAKEPVLKEDSVVNDEYVSITDSTSHVPEQSESIIPKESQSVGKQEPLPPPVQTTQVAKAEKKQSQPSAIGNQVDSSTIEVVADAELMETEDLAVDAAAKEGNGMAAPTAATEERAVTSTMKAKKDAAAEPVPDQKEPEPIGGMSSYKTYLENNIVYPQQAIDNKIKGTVVLDVTINPNGTIKSITVVKGLGYGCDEEAKRLVNEGPKWKPAAEGGSTIEATQQIKVRFKL